jgi:hypothetical protein
MSYASEHIRPAVARVVANRFSPNDLTRILLYIRQNSYGNKLIEDIGDFIAHHEQRDKGLSYEHVKCSYVKLAAFIDTRDGAMQSDKLPWYIKDLIRCQAELRRREGSLKRIIGMDKKKLEGWINEIIRSRTDRSCYIAEKATPRDLAVLNLLIGSLDVGASLTTQDEITHEIINNLAKNRLLNKNEVDLFHAAGNKVMCFLLTRIHGSKIFVNEKYAAKFGESGDSIRINLRRIRGQHTH